MLRKDQYARALGLENAVKIASSGCQRPSEPYGSWSLEEILDLADQFTDYIEMGRQ